MHKTCVQRIPDCNHCVSIVLAEVVYDWFLRGSAGFIIRTSDWVLVLLNNLIIHFTTCKRGNVRVTWHCGAFAKLLSPWKSNKYYISCACVFSLSYPPCKEHAPYYIAICGLSGSSTLLSTLSLKRHDILRRIFWITIINVRRTARKVPVILVGFF